MNLKEKFKKIVDSFTKEKPDEPIYDPLHIGMMIILVISAAAILFWLLWSILVFKGGIFPKITAVWQIIFQGKTVHDFGYVGTPYEMGVFEGWTTNLGAVILLVFLIITVWWLFKKTARKTETKALNHGDTD